MREHIERAINKAHEAIEIIRVLTPGSNDDATREANRRELRAAHELIRSAQQDLVEARQNARQIVQGLKEARKSAADETREEDDSGETE
jgi:hypothetical protein